ncbi:cadmium resistance transporter [Chryseolinea sp. T2]|uniref:cadmium resistance transporter n=1 Tax=Chryseolinea sp. T2 TaxID=3129255 RepID=UPI003076E1E3
MIQTIVASILAFAATNIDDIFILMLLYGNRRIASANILLGQLLGLGTLVFVSYIGSFIGSIIDQRFIGLLGLFPIYLAVTHTISLIRNNAEADEESAVPMKTTSLIAIAGVTIANGGDNIGVYVPLMATMDQFEKIQLILVFGIMTYLWCVIARYLSNRPVIARQLEKYGHIAMPIVLFLLGVLILAESGTLSLII